MENRSGSRAPLPTGFARLDAALGGGGLPAGSIVEIFGPSCGKTTLALGIVAHVQNSGSTAGWIDADRTFDPGYAVALGVAIERLPLIQPGSAEDGLDIACRLVRSGGLDLLVVDSAAALVPVVELQAAIGGSGPGLQGRVLASGLRKLAAAVKTGATVLVLNQARTRLEPSPAEPETSAGGPALKLYAAVRIALSPAGAARVRFRILKNKAGGGSPEGELEWRKGEGFVNSP